MPVLSVPIDGSAPEEIIRRDFIDSVRWAADDKSIAVKARCDGTGSEPLAWRADGASVFLATGSNGCRVEIVGRLRAHAVVSPASAYNRGPDVVSGVVSYLIDTRTRSTTRLRRFGLDTELTEIGRVPGANRVVALISIEAASSSTAGRLLLVPFNRAAPVALPPLRPPRGTKYVGPAAAGFTR
jgi:hypothetical protein